MSEMERDIWQHLAGRLNRHPTREDEVLVQGVIDGIKLSAEQRAVHSFVTASGTRQKYLEDPDFHMAVIVVARTMVAGVFGDTPLSPEEQHERNRAMEELMRKLT
jgi:hypothetical protein